ncbi:MAG: hypothetical protein K2W82_04870 [Candidatus Obscuribacterales bacterium]|nr:hypothetical protein [Candidatus Obscuribacterales bacterium]
MQNQKLSTVVKSFSWRECALWFLIPSIGLSLVPSLLIYLLNPTTASWSRFIDGYQNVFVNFGILAGLWSVALYLLTFWTGAFWRPILITGTICFVIFGNFNALLATFDESESDRGTILPELTKEEIAQRDREYRDALLVGGSLFAFIGIAGVLFCRRISHLMCHQATPESPTEKEA